MWKLAAILFVFGCVLARLVRSRIPGSAGGRADPPAALAGLTTAELVVVLSERLKSDEEAEKRRAEAAGLLKGLQAALKPPPPKP